MNKKEISEIKRRLSHDKNTVTAIKGCYVGKDGTVITTFDRSLHTMSQEDEDRYYAVFRRVLSGEIGQNLLNMDFPAGEVAVSPQQRLLAELRSSSLTNEDAVRQLYDKIISAVQETAVGHKRNDPRSAVHDDDSMPKRRHALAFRDEFLPCVIHPEDDPGFLRPFDPDPAAVEARHQFLVGVTGQAGRNRT